MRRFHDHLAMPQSWNRYSYAKGNPIRYVDPDGAVAAEVIGGAVFVASEGGATAGGASALGSVVVAASAAPGAAILATGVGGVAIGSLIRQIPGVDESIQAGFDAAFDSILVAQNTRQQLKVVNGNILTAIEHLGKIGAAGGPEKDPDFKHHKDEIKAALKRALRVANRLPGKLRDASIERIKEIASRLEMTI